MAQNVEPAKQVPGSQKLNILQWVFGSAGVIIIIGGISYFLGRLYLDAYYRCYGVSEGVLLFEPQQYMYYSFPVMMMLLGAIAWIPMVYWRFRQGEYTLINTTQPLKQQKVDILVEVGLLMFSIGFLFIYFVWHNDVAIFGSMAYTGLILGFFGVAFYRDLFILFSWLYLHEKRREDRIARTNLRMTYFVVFLLVILPVLTSELGQIGAISDYDSRSQVTIIADNLPVGLQPLSNSENTTLRAKMLIINNDIVYIYKPETNTKPKDSRQLALNGRVYALKLSDIKCLIYSSEKYQNNN